MEVTKAEDVSIGTGESKEKDNIDATGDNKIIPDDYDRKRKRGGVKERELVGELLEGIFKGRRQIWSTKESESS